MRLVGWRRRQAELVRDVGAGRVLDVGCGPAGMLVPLGGRPVFYLGLDRNAAMLAEARQRVSRAGATGAVVQADATALPFRDNAFDVVVATGVLGLLPREPRARALREIARVARAEVRLIEPVHAPGHRRPVLRSRAIALAADGPLEPADLLAAGLADPVVGRSVLGGAYHVVRTTPAP